MSENTVNMTALLRDPEAVKANFEKARILADDEKIEFTLEGFFNAAKSLPDFPDETAKVQAILGLIATKLIM